jgi:hypothetical protein
MATATKTITVKLKRVAPWWFVRFPFWVAFYVTGIGTFAISGKAFACGVWCCSLVFLTIEHVRHRKAMARLDKDFVALTKLLEYPDRILAEHVRRAPLN